MTTLVAFDMGNVLLPFDHMIACQNIAGMTRLTPRCVYSKIFESNIAQRFELGQISPKEFARECEGALERKLETPTFQRYWSNIFCRDKEVFELVFELAQSSRLCLVSNTNVWHFEHVCDSYPEIGVFENRVLSYEIGSLKPDPAIYNEVLKFSDGCDECVFVDDNAENVKAATAAGFNGIHFSGADSLRISIDSIFARH